MNIFGFKIIRDSRYVVKEDCNRFQNGIHKRISEVEDHIVNLFNTRIDDLKDLLKTRGGEK